MFMKHFIENERAKPLSPKDVVALSYRKGLKAVDYEDLAGKTIKEILPEAECGRLIFFNDKNRKIGHFCLLYKTPQTGIIFFDSLGLGLRNVARVTHNKKHLQKLLQSVDFHDNRVKYQRLEDDVNTCGRWAVTRWNAAHLEPKAFEKLMHHGKMHGDDLVVLLTLERDFTKL